MIVTAETYHVPVLLKESVDGLDIQPDGIYVDVTFGGGGHSREILSHLGKNGHLYSFDQDADAEKNLVADDRFTFVRSNFRYISQWMRYYQVEKIDGILADLGVSSHHFDDETRGFSFRFDAPLDMRMNKRAGQTAADILNDYTEEQLADVLYLYGELKNARRLAKAIVNYRSSQRIETTGELLTALGIDAKQRSESRDGCLTRHASWGYGTAKRRGTTECHHLSLIGRPHREERDEGWQCRGKDRTRLLWSRISSLPTDWQDDNTQPRGTRTQSTQSQCQTENRRKDLMRKWI